jgi:nitronate monooxygenase
VVSGTALDQILVRRLQDGDPDGDVRRALAAFPFPRMADRILKMYFIPGGKGPDGRYAQTPMHTADSGNRELQELIMAGNFMEVFLAREHHGNPVGINYLEKIQIPHLPSLYGAMLAGVAVVIIGAGIPLEIPGVLDALSEHNPATYPLAVSGATGSVGLRLSFDPRTYHEEGPPLPSLQRPAFLPIIASLTLATVLTRRSNGAISGFVIEGPTAGGHNAPPRGAAEFTADGEPVYGARDVVDLEGMRKLGYPFWLAGGYGSPERLREALSQGAAGVQVGTAFALCTESGLTPEIRRALVRKALKGEAHVRTDPVASPAGFPFKVAALEGTLSDSEIYRRRRRVCDLGFLRTPYRRADGSIGYRCSAESEAAFVAKGGTAQDAAGRMCLCNGLVANVGMPQRLSDGTYEPCVITLGDDFAGVGRFCRPGQIDFSAADVIRILKSGQA